MLPQWRFTATIVRIICGLVLWGNFSALQAQDWIKEWERNLQEAKKEGVIVAGIPARAELRKELELAFNQESLGRQIQRRTNFFGEICGRDSQVSATFRPRIDDGRQRLSFRAESEKSFFGCARQMQDLSRPLVMTNMNFRVSLHSLAGKQKKV